MKIVMYTRLNPPCSYCEGAKLYLQDRGLPYEENIIGKHLTREEFVETFPADRSIPLIFVDGEKVGGYTEMKSYIEAQELLKGLDI